MADLIPGHVYIATAGTEPGGEGWTDIGETEGPVEIQFDRKLQAAGEPAWQPWPAGPVTASATLPLTDAIGKQGYVLLGPAWLIYRAPDGRWFEGEGPGLASAMADARRKWRGVAGPLAVNGHKYHRRALARQKRRKR